MRPLVVENIGVLATMNGSGVDGLGLLSDAMVVCVDGVIAHVGARGSCERPEGAIVVDAQGMAVVPGLIDSHTHALFMGERSDEFARRARGESYTQIAAAGGGIFSTMRAVRAASVDELVEAARPRLMQMSARGVTTVEIKSG